MRAFGIQSYARWRRCSGSGLHCFLYVQRRPLSRRAGALAAVLLVGALGSPTAAAGSASHPARGHRLSHQVKLRVSAIAIGRDLRVSGTITAHGSSLQREGRLRLILQQRVRGRWVTRVVTHVSTVLRRGEFELDWRNPSSRHRRTREASPSIHAASISVQPVRVTVSGGGLRVVSQPIQPQLVGPVTGPNTCPSALFIGVRGSGETATDAGGYGATINAVLTALQGRDSSVNDIAIDYQALGVRWYDPRYYGYRYNHSVGSGIGSLLAELTGFLSACHQSHVYLAGYSQGAQVVGDTYLGWLSDSERARITRVVLIGDPKFWGGQGAPVDDGDYNARKHGIATVAGSQHVWTGADLAKVRSYCANGDPVCNFSSLGQAAGCGISQSTCPHTQYMKNIDPKHGIKYTDAAAQFLAGGARGSGKPSTNPPQRVKVPPASGTGGVRTSPPFDECPPIGGDTSCSVLILVAANGQTTLLNDPSQGAYDGTDDTTVGVLNQSLASVPSFSVSGSGIFDFDGDGLCADSLAPAGCPFGSTGYEGPGTVLNAAPGTVDSGSVSFPGGLPPGGSTYFSLEGAATSLVAKPPAVVTGNATAITSDAATINGTVDPQGADSTYYVEYGTDTSYGANTATATVNATPSESATGDVQPVQVQLGGLSQQTLYHYRLVASNPLGTTYGSDQTFTTAAPQPIDAYSNYGPATAGHAMCRGNPGDSTSVPGGSATQTFTVPAGVASLSSALVQIDPDPTVNAHADLSVNGNIQASADATPVGDTHFDFGTVPVSPGDQVALSLSFSATSGSIITVYSAAMTAGTLTLSNPCPAGAPSLTTSAGLRAVVSGLTP